MAGVIILLGLAFLVILGIRQGDQRLQKEEKQEAEKLRKEKEAKPVQSNVRIMRVNSFPPAGKKIPAITVPVGKPTASISKLPTRKVEQRVSIPYTSSVRAEDSGNIDTDGFAMGKLVGHLFENSSNDSKVGGSGSKE